MGAYRRFKHRIFLQVSLMFGCLLAGFVWWSSDDMTSVLHISLCSWRSCAKVPPDGTESNDRTWAVADGVYNFGIESMTSEDLETLWLQSPCKERLHFRPTLSGRSFQLFLHTLNTFSRALDASNITYFMYGGTLIGSWRHHGLIPWDDDVDFIVDSSEREQLFRCLHAYKSEFTTTVSWDRWKFFSRDAQQIKKINKTGYHNHSWPFIDISFYRMRPDNYIFDADTGYSALFSYPFDVVFPLVRRPFLNMWLPAPQDTFTFLSTNYQLQDCVSPTFNHKMERRVHTDNQTVVKCNQLYDCFPFVFRHDYINGTVETLCNGKDVLHQVALPYFT